MTPADDRVQEGPATGGAAAPEVIDATAVETPQVEAEESTSEDDELRAGGRVAKVAGGDMVAKMAQMNSSR